LRLDAGFRGARRSGGEKEFAPEIERTLAELGPVPEVLRFAAEHEALRSTGDAAAGIERLLALHGDPSFQLVERELALLSAVVLATQERIRCPDTPGVGDSFAAHWEARARELRIPLLRGTALAYLGRALEQSGNRSKGRNLQREVQESLPGCAGDERGFLTWPWRLLAGPEQRKR
jgi:hypothetical protein